MDRYAPEDILAFWSLIFRGSGRHVQHGFGVESMAVLQLVIYSQASHLSLAYCILPIRQLLFMRVPLPTICNRDESAAPRLGTNACDKITRIRKRRGRGPAQHNTAEQHHGKSSQHQPTTGLPLPNAGHSPESGAPLQIDATTVHRRHNNIAAYTLQRCHNNPQHSSRWSRSTAKSSCNHLQT